MKKVLIISYYWPPSGGSGVQRWLKQVKYLRDYNWEPVVFTADNGELPVLDPSFEKDIPKNIEIIRFPIWEPYNLYKKIASKNKNFEPGLIAKASSGSFLERISVFIRGNFFIPDARMFWIKPSSKFIKEYLNKNHIDAIISTGPPHTTHMIAMDVKKDIDIPWIADFRDPWTKIDFYKKLKLTKWADRKHRELESQVISKSDKVVTVSWKWASDFKKEYERDVDVITNGYDEDDFKNIKIDLNNKFNILHCGVMKENRNPFVLWEALNHICKINQNFANSLSIDIVGNCDDEIINSIKRNNLGDKLKMFPYVPHDEIINIMGSSQVLLLSIERTNDSHGIIPGKLYEYIASERPVLAIGPSDADSSKIIQETNSGEFFEFDDFEGVKNFIEKAYKNFLNGNLNVNSNNEIKKFSRKKLTGDFADLLNSLI